MNAEIEKEKRIGGLAEEKNISDRAARRIINKGKVKRIAGSNITQPKKKRK